MKIILWIVIITSGNSAIIFQQVDATYFFSFGLSVPNIFVSMKAKKKQKNCANPIKI